MLLRRSRYHEVSLSIMNRKTTGLILIMAGICLALVALMFSSEYNRKDNLIWNLIRSIISGEVVFRERAFTVVQDRDEKVYGEFQDYRSEHPEYNSLPEDEIIERFYADHYRDKMHRMEFQLKLNKKKIQVEQEQIALPYKYVFISSVLFICIGFVLLIMHIVRKKRLRKEHG